MNDLELAIAGTLRADAEEASMNTDTNQEYEVLAGRLDELDRHRRRRVWVGAAAAAAAVVLIALSARAIGGDGDPSPVGPSPSSSPAPRFTSTGFVPATSLVLPTWIRQSSSLTSGGDATELYWRACWDKTCPGVESSALLAFTVQSARTGRASPDIVPIRSAADLLARFDEMQRLEEVTLSDRTAVVVDGHAGIMFSVEERSSITDGFACEDTAGATCFNLAAGDWDRLVVLDHGSQVIVLVASTATTNPERGTIQQQFEAMLSTVRFGDGATPTSS
jgi:hypothetical protein